MPLPKPSQVLDYAKPVEESGMPTFWRVVGAAACVVAFFMGILVFIFGVSVIWEAFTESPSRDRAYFLSSGSVVCIIGLLFAGFSTRWFLNAVIEKHGAAEALDQPADGEESPPR